MKIPLHKYFLKYLSLAAPISHCLKQYSQIPVNILKRIIGTEWVEKIDWYVLSFVGETC